MTFYYRISSSEVVPYCEIYQLQQPLLHSSLGLQLQLFSLLVPHTCLVFARPFGDLKHKKKIFMQTKSLLNPKCKN
jgi:hypothetical protein